MKNLVWKFPQPLVEGILIKRYKRFLADITLKNGEQITAHCPNTGSMKSCWSEGDCVYLLPDSNPKRKLKYTWELSKTPQGYIGINTVRPNQVIHLAVQGGHIPELKDYTVIRKEVKYGGENSRIDLLLENELGEKCYVEIKNTTLLVENTVQFPDSVTTRGQKHLRELREMVKQGHRAVIFFYVNRPEGDAFLPADEIDPQYGALLREVKESGVELLAYRATTTPEGVSELRPVEVQLP